MAFLIGSEPDERLVGRVHDPWYLLVSWEHHVQLEERKGEETLRDRLWHGFKSGTVRR